MSFDELYRHASAAFGEAPNRLLERFGDRIEGSGPVVDVGAGQGRNAFFLARRGHVVEALDPSAVAVEILSRAAQEQDLPVHPRRTGFADFRLPEDTTASAVLLIGLIPILTWDDIDDLVRSVARWSGPGTLLFVTAFGTDEPAHPRIRRDWPQIGRNSYRREDGDIRTYLEPGEVLGLFGPCETLHHDERMGPIHRHGDGPEHQHFGVEAVLRLT